MLQLVVVFDKSAQVVEIVLDRYWIISDIKGLDIVIWPDRLKHSADLTSVNLAPVQINML